MLLYIISLIANHFGIKPKNGGKPAIDNIIIIKVGFVFDIFIVILLVVSSFITISNINIIII